MGFANPHALATTEWLAEHLDDPKVRLVEVDEDTTAYERGHIPNAIAWHWERDLHHPVQRDYIDQPGLSALLARAGVDDDTTVVLYGGNNNWFAAYAYWLLKYRGFDQVTLLDGGRKKWELEGRDLTTDVPSLPETDFRIREPERPELRALRDDVIGAVDRAEFVDVRSPEEFSGQKLAPDHLPQEQPYVAGHIPGAANVPWSKAAREDGTFKPIEELRELYEGAGVDGDGEVIAYCRIGERSSHTWFVLSELLGLDNVRNYDGSWTEYGSLVGVPVERDA
ncbi:sulfurtransferase [Egibacter rhizosphaerae]|uniref:Sulfurtransferase n=1 Tax=Egibacter rhizosphaerae TaxID=1670831 RepID=A0A411YB71_9ACTN|nr:sulfurtransferase [Egibacter rhizosphaerae]QBI18439.1 sulfurtransferase [Egibacter rhizosphaerae]